MFCGRCGNKLNDGDRFCGVCGSVVQPIAPAPVVEEPVVEQPVAPAPVVEAPVVEQPVAPVVEAPVVEQPVAPAPVVEEPVVEQPVAPAPVVEEPVVEQPVEPAPVVEEPVIEQPVAPVPIVEEPVLEQPVAPAPVVEEPVVEQSVVPVPVVNIVEQNTMPVPPMQPVYQEPVPNTNYGDAYNQVPAQKQKKVRTLKQTSAGVKVLSIFLCIFMFCFALSSTMVCIVRNFLAEENITQVMEEFDVSDIKLVDKYGKQVTLTDVIYNTIKDETKEKYGISKKDVGSYLAGRDVNRFLEEIVLDYADFFLTGDKIEKLTADEVIEFIQDNQKDIERKLGYTFTQDDFDYIENEFESGSLRYINFSELEERGINSAIISLPLSILSLVLTAVIAFGLFILILVANSRSIRLWFAYSGVTFVVLGSLYLLSAFTGYIEVLINVIPVLSAFIAPLCLQFLIFGGSFFVVGLIMLIISHAIKKRQKKAMAQMNQMPQQA